MRTLNAMRLNEHFYLTVASDEHEQFATTRRSMVGYEYSHCHYAIVAYSTNTVIDMMERYLLRHKEDCGCSRWNGTVIETTCHHCKGDGCSECHTPGILYDFSGNIFWMADHDDEGVGDPGEWLDQQDAPVSELIGTKLLEYRRSQIKPDDVMMNFELIAENAVEDVNSFLSPYGYEECVTAVLNSLNRLKDVLKISAAQALTLWHGEPTGGVHVVSEDDFEEVETNE